MSEPPAKKRSPRRPSSESPPAPAPSSAPRRAAAVPAASPKKAGRGRKAPVEPVAAPVVPAPTPVAPPPTPALAPKTPTPAPVPRGLPLGTLVESLPDPVFAKDLQGRYQFINPAGARVLGRSVEQVVGRSDAELFSPEAAAAAIARDRQVLSTGQPLTYETLEATPSGTRVWLSTQGPLKDGEGKVLGLVGVSRDITRHQNVEEDRSLNVERLRLCMDTAQVAIWDWDMDEGRIRWSENVASILGGVPGDTYESFFQRVLAEDQGRFARQVSTALQNFSDFEVEFRVYVTGGAPRWVRAKARVLSEDGLPKRVLGALRDITHERRVAEESRRAFDFQEQLTDIISHDIRSPLGAIISWARIMALGGPPPEEQQRTFRRITSAALRIERLTRLLLDFARARLGGGVTLEPRRCDLHELLQKVTHEFRVAYPDRSVLCEQVGEPATGTWDPDRLAQVVSNLLENALKYSPPDTQVTLTATGEKEHVLLAVHNQGKPIPPELMPHIFEPFRPGPTTARTVKTSYGLGLYIVQEIVRAHGGTIEVRSDIEEGTTFTVRLPRMPPAALELMRRPSPAGPQRA
ncbi:sensor histidine kinase [Hyalangium rubrum]|uniref:histidine kinase n=1 Tax=Hyalangium rubrum TaxID=3103134 RepID=A0ABU5H948_9BACT|nr:PAS domain-containing protein [Hyalangium sp. s54d21]MDY7230000.1 PAS domain-containing protein [Hyalangium sp. s54d21]